MRSKRSIDVIRVADFMQRDNVALACARRARAIELRGDGERYRDVTPIYVRLAEAEVKLQQKQNGEGADHRAGRAADVDAQSTRSKCAAFPAPWRREFFESELTQRRPLQPRGARATARSSATSSRCGSSTRCTSTRSPSTPAQRRQGIALALMERCLAFARRARREVDLARSAPVERRRAGVLPPSSTSSRRTSAPRYYPDGEAAVVMTR